jgi:Fe-S cluster assembly protein SufD
MTFEERIDVHAERHKKTLKIRVSNQKAWKYTSLNTILKNDFTVFPKADNNIQYSDVKILLRTNRQPQSCFIDGVLALTFLQPHMKELTFA